MGLYQVEPASTRFWFGSPIFDKVSVRVAGGKSFTVEAIDNSTENRYIQGVLLDGKPYGKPYIEFSDIEAGRTLTFRMGPEPVLWY